MSIKKIVSSVVSATLLATSFTLPSYAEETFSTVQEFLTDVISLSTSEVESQSLDAAIEAAINKVTTVGDEVFYDGTSIGYWYSDSSSTLWTSESKEATVITTDTNGYTVSPSILYDILYDVNDKLEDNYVPTTSDWSKIIGKYDVKLGNITIPADQWISMNPGDNLGNNKAVNLSTLTGIKDSDLGSAYSGNNIYVSAWMIDKNGDLYLQNGVTWASTFNTTSGLKYTDNVSWLFASSLASTTLIAPYTGGSSKTVFCVDNPLQKVCLSGSTEDSITNGLHVTYCFTDITQSSNYAIHWSSTATTKKLQFDRLYKVCDPAVKNMSDISTAKKTGIFYFLGSQAPSITSSSTLFSEHTKMFESCSTSKLVKGNQKLTRRLSALATLLPTDTVTVTATNWTINGHDNSIDNYITDQDINNAGDTADIAAVADIDALKFHVIVPTSLPIYVDDSNITYVANNADIINKSGAAVKLTGVNIVAAADSGWTMVDGSPTKEMEGHEFNFSTTIEQNKVLDVSEVYPFQYMAKLSPTTEASSSLELATVMVTVDWANT